MKVLSVGALFRLGGGEDLLAFGDRDGRAGRVGITVSMMMIVRWRT